MGTNINQRMAFDIERSNVGAVLGSFKPLQTPGGVGPLTQNPVIIIFDNQSANSLAISVDAVNIWKTFSAGETFVLDCRANHGVAANMTIDVGTQFYVTSTAANGDFKISIIYAI